VDWVWRYLFWVVLAALLLVAAGLYGLFVPGKQQEIAKLRADCDRDFATVKKKADNSSDLLTSRHVEAAIRYGEDLKVQESAVKVFLADKQTVMPADFENAPERPLDFDNWLSGVRKQVLDEAAQAGLELPAQFAVNWLDEGKTTADAQERQERLEKVALVREIIRVLAQTRVPVTLPQFEKDMDKPEPTAELAVGALALDGLELLTNEARLAYEKKALEIAFTAGAATAVPVGKAAVSPEPYGAVTLDLRFTAPLPVVPAIIQTLEACPLWYGIVRKIDMQRSIEPYDRSSEIGIASPVLEDSRNPRLNTHFREAPVQIALWLDLLSFDKAKLEQYGKPVKVQKAVKK
jgi:hypothetical protein